MSRLSGDDMVPGTEWCGLPGSIRRGISSGDPLEAGTEGATDVRRLGKFGTCVHVLFRGCVPVEVECTLWPEGTEVPPISGGVDRML